MNQNIGKHSLSGFCMPQGTGFKEVSAHSGPSLVFATHSGDWYVDVGGRWHHAGRAGWGPHLAQFLPLSIWDREALPAFAQPLGAARVEALGDGSMNITTTHDAHTRVCSVDSNSATAAWGRWVSGAYNDDWLAGQAVLQYDCVAEIQLDFYLPQDVAASDTKTVVISCEGSLLEEIAVPRDGVTRVSVKLPEEQRAGFLEVACASLENKAKGGDGRALGVLLAGIRLLAPEESAKAYSVQGRAGRNFDLIARFSASRSGNNTAGLALGTPSFDADISAGGKPRVAVVCWDLCHNPVGRALVLYQLLSQIGDIELVGPRWAHCGGVLWPPLEGLDLNVRSFPCATFADFYPQAAALAASQAYDLVYICKPRLPGILLGLLIKEASACPVLLDVDDYELSFFGDPGSLPLDEAGEMLSAAFAQLDGEVATRISDGLISEFDVLTVSNVALQAKYGGHIIRHARDGRAFDPSPEAASAARRRLDIAPEVFAVFFIGTVRRHKGVVELARRLADVHGLRPIELHIVAPEISPQILAELKAVIGVEVRFHEPVRFADLPATLAAADCVVLLQAAGHIISRFQIPAKISDALALGVPVLVSPVPPVRDLIAQGAVTAVTDDTFGSIVGGLMAPSGQVGWAKKRLREVFDAEFGLEVNRARLSNALDAAACRTSPLSDKLQALLNSAREAYARSQRSGTGGDAKRKANTVSQGYDIVYFWKQNDCHLYGRRADMLPQYLLKTGRVGRVLRFDLPMDVDKLHRHSIVAEDVSAQSCHVQRATVNNLLHLNDRDDFRCRTFLNSKMPGKSFMGQEIPQPEDYARFVRREMEVWGLDPASTLAFVSPIVPQFPALAREIGFAHTLVDLVDDQRLFDVPADTVRQWETCYRETLALADAVITNCEPLAKTFAHYCKHDIEVIPNGADTLHVLAGDGAEDEAALLMGIRQPIAGYAGNLRDRVDWSLVMAAASKLPDVSFVFIGGGLQPEIRQLFAGVSNVHFPGVIEYTHLGAYLSKFSVAIMPHTKDEMTANMNPLKLYTYLCHDLPVVSTDVDNIEAELEGGILIAATAEEFTNMVCAALDQKKPRARVVLDQVSWSGRASRVVQKIDTIFR